MEKNYSLYSPWLRRAVRQNQRRLFVDSHSAAGKYMAMTSETSKRASLANNTQLSSRCYSTTCPYSRLAPSLLVNQPFLGEGGPDHFYLRGQSASFLTPNCSIRSVFAAVFSGQLTF